MVTTTHTVPVPPTPTRQQAPKTSSSARPGHGRTRSTHSRVAGEESKPGGQRMRAHRRRTDGSTLDSEPSPIQRPRTAHGPASPKFSTYSQYPDFETVADPFAKSDKIPRKRVPTRPAVPHVQQQNQQQQQQQQKVDVDSAITAEEHEGGSRLTPQTPAAGSYSSKTIAAMPEWPAVTLHDVSGFRPPRPRKDSQEHVPTPLRRRDLIPRHSEHPEAFAHMKPAQQQQSKIKANGASVPAAVSSPAKPVARAESYQSSRSNGSHSTAGSAFPNRQQQQQRISHSAGAVHGRRISSRPSLSHSLQSGRPFSGHDLSPRIQIDMDKVEGLYQRQSQIFEKEKKHRDSQSPASVIASVPSSNADSKLPLQPQHPPTPISAASSPATVHELQQAANLDDISDDRIPFQDVLIPMVFKKLCKDLEDPSFEIDEEAYRKFKLSERWYAREERKLRKHIDEANSHTPVSQTPTSNSPELDKQSPSVPETVPEEEEKEQVQHDQLPERKRTRSSKRSVTGGMQAVIPRQPAASHQPSYSKGIPRGYESPDVPPRVSSATAAAHEYRLPPAGNSNSAHSGTRQDAEQMASRFAQLDVHDPQQYPQSTHHQHRSYYQEQHHQQQHEQPRHQQAAREESRRSAGCCGCTIM